MTIAGILRQRERLLGAVREFFKREGFTEVETPLLVPSPGLEPHLDAFEVCGSATGRRAFLPTSPEYAMKKLVAAGSGSIFQVSKAFRDEPPGAHHLPEFTMLEWYRVGADYRAAMEDCERLCGFAAAAVCGRTVVEREGRAVDLAPPYDRMSVRDAFRRWAGVDITFAEPVETLRQLAHAAGCMDVSEGDDWDDAFFKMFLRCVEPNLGRARPTILFDYPARMAALSRISASDPLVCERFELYAGGLELANAFTELTDPVEQRRRFEADNVRRRELGRQPLPIDADFLRALERGLPDCTGVALGLDRLLALLTGAADIRLVVPLAPA